uniref:Protein FAM65B n=1 Tax=Aceria tosichella TaxID=561515 RepID=A0A6G1S8H0_9ACAR
MDNLLESNERTLDIFDSVCSGLAGCLALVHADIRQMIEHRDQLAYQLEHDANERAHNRDACAETDLNYNDDNTLDETIKQTDLDVSGPAESITTPKIKTTSSSQANRTNDVADPHHLAHLKLLDKRLADSFSQALSLCDQQQKSSLFNNNNNSKKSQLVSSSQRPSLFQMLLGKSNQNKSDKRRDLRTAKSPKEPVDEEKQLELDTRAVIDDINRQTRLAMQYSKQLEAHLFKVEDLRAKYEMHLKMGLVVKSVSRAYLNSNPYSSSSLAASQHHLINPHNSLGRTRGQHHSSTLMVNDHSSLGTRSSLSSLNLSTWSFSRRQHSDRSAASRKNPACCQMGPNDTVDGYNRSSTSSLARNQKCASTISLDSMHKQRRSNLSKLISLTTAKQNHKHQDDEHYETNSSGQQHNIDASQMINCQCNHKYPVDSPTLPSPRTHGTPPYNNTEICPPSPSPASRPPYQQYVYGTTTEFATPTAAGTLAGGYVDASGSVVLGDQTHVGGGLSGSLHKSASHSSLKRGGRNYHKSAMGQSQHQLTNHGTKTTIKEFIDNIERIEAEFESYMGSFLLNIEDIQGFARVCQGDVFEINIKYGDSQKFKTKISVLKENRQKCDHRQSVFKARIADVIAIKAYECKGLGKKVLLGHKLCETRDLFTARSQLMTISLNQTGSIKLNLVITWNPLHLTPKGHDISHVSLPPTPISSSTLSSLSSGRSSMNGVNAIATDNNTTLINIQANNNSGRKIKLDSPVSKQASPTSKCLECAGPACCHHKNHRLSNPVISSRDQATVYQGADAIYSYHIPEPDYLTTGDVKF